MKRTSAPVYSLTAAQKRRIVEMSPSVYHIVKECRDVLAREVETLRRKGSIVGSKASERLDCLNSIVEEFQREGLCEEAFGDFMRTASPRDRKCGKCRGGYCVGCDKTAPKPPRKRVSLREMAEEFNSKLPKFKRNADGSFSGHVSAEQARRMMEKAMESGAECARIATLNKFKMVEASIRGEKK